MASLPFHDDSTSALLHREWPLHSDFGYPQQSHAAGAKGHAQPETQKIALIHSVALSVEQSTPRKRKRGNDFAEQPSSFYQRSDLRTSSQASYVQQHMPTSSYHLQQHYSPSACLSSEPGYLCSSTPQLTVQSCQEGCHLQCNYSALDSCQYFQPGIVPELDYEGYVSHSPAGLASPSSLPSANKTCTGSLPILDHRAAHTLTYLRSGSDGDSSCFNRSTSFPCEEQVCTKDDCPEAKVICPAEKIEAQFCDGNCAGRLCTGAGCPYDNNVSASLFCNWDPGNGVCNISHQGALHGNFEDSMETLDPQNCLLQCGGLSPHGKAHSTYGDKFLCHDGDCPPFLDVGICYDPSCIPPAELAQCYWQHCNPELIRQDNPMEPMTTIHQHSPSVSSTPVSQDELEGSRASKTCLWVIDTASERTCGFTCQHGNELQKHLEETHFDSQKPQRCQSRASSSTKKALVCQWKDCKHHLQKKTFGQMQALRQHGYTHSGYKSAQCTICGQMFVDKINLEGHMRTHTGEKPYTCRYCGYKSAARATWITHERTHTGEKTLHCDLCSYSCGDSSNFARHKASHGEGKFQCEVCKHSFKRHEHLTRHMKSGVHSGDKKQGGKRRSAKEKAPISQQGSESI